jgi:hypothetical protein
MNPRATIATSLFCVSAAVMTGAAQQHPVPPAERGNHVVMEWSEFKDVTQWNERRLQDDGRAKDEFIIPWEEVKALLDIDIKQVNTAELKLPWKEFKKLLEWSVRHAEAEKAKTVEDPVPVPYLITSADYISTEISEEGAQFTATFGINILEEKGWKRIDLLPAGVAVSDVDLPEGVHLQMTGSHYALLTKMHGELEAKITFSVTTTETAGAYGLRFEKVQSGTCVVDVTVPGDNNIDIDMIGAQSALAKAGEKGTRVVAAYPPNTSVAVSWEPATPEAATVAPKLYSETRTLISVADGLLLGHAQVEFSILHTPTRTLELNVTPGVSVLEVLGKDIRDWRVSNDQLTIQLDKETIGTAIVDVKYEASLDMTSDKAIIPVVTGSGVEREKGHIAVVALTNVEINGDAVTGAHAVDVKSLPSEIMGMTSQPILLAFRYVAPEFKVGLVIAKHMDVDVLLTVVDRAHFTVMQTFDGRRITRAIYNVRNNRNQFLRLTMPKGSEIWSATVAGRATQPAKDAEGRVLLPLVRSEGRSGMSAFPVEIVYAETGTKPDARGRGTARIDLPSCSEPIMHMMVNLHVPEDGRYRDFEGSLRPVKNFTPVAGARIAAIQGPQGNQVAQQLQSAFVQHNQARVAKAGASPIEVQLPISGSVHRFEKILIVKGEEWLSYTYTGLER